MKTSMSMHVSLNGTAAGVGERKAGIGRTVRRAAALASAWLETCRDYYEAATIYEQLSGLSDAELRRRGLSRTTLASEIVKACDRTNP
jgi:hypothetical protein